jgi:hypothetical protein
MFQVSVLQFTVEPKANISCNRQFESVSMYKLNCVTLRLTFGNWLHSCHQTIDYLYGTEFQPDCHRQRPHNLHETSQLPRVQLITPDDGHSSRCPKHSWQNEILDTWCILLVIYTKIFCSRLRSYRWIPHIRILLVSSFRKFYIENGTNRLLLLLPSIHFLNT